MCGIFGAIGEEQNIQVLTSLALLNMARGKMSSGFTDGKILTKDIGSMQQLIIHNREKWYTRAPIKLGHTRLASHGMVTKKNAHPYEFSKIIGAHNGIISNFDLVQYEMKTRFEVDSQLLFSLLNDGGITKVCEQLTGSIGAWWYEKATQYIHLLKHDQELAMATCPGVTYFSSDKQDLLVFFPKKIIRELRQNEHIIVDKQGKILQQEIVKFSKKEVPYKEIWEGDYYKNGGRLEKGLYNRGTYIRPSIPCGKGVYYLPPGSALSKKEDTLNEIRYFCATCMMALPGTEIIESDGVIQCSYCKQTVKKCSSVEEALRLEQEIEEQEYLLQRAESYLPQERKFYGL